MLNGELLPLLTLAPPGRRKRGEETGDSPTPPPLCREETGDSPTPPPLCSDERGDSPTPPLLCRDERGDSPNALGGGRGALGLS